MEHTYTYVSVACSNYHALFATLLQMHIPFEYHDKRRSGYSYADFTLDNERNPSFGEIMEIVDRNQAVRGKKLQIKILSKYTY